MRDQPERARRALPEDSDKRTAKRQDSELDAADRGVAAKPALAYLAAERGLTEWRWALADLSLVDASMIICMLLKLLGTRVFSR